MLWSRLMLVKKLKLLFDYYGCNIISALLNYPHSGINIIMTSPDKFFGPCFRGVFLILMFKGQDP